jgi:hypothetical protein
MVVPIVLVLLVLFSLCDCSLSLTLNNYFLLTISHIEISELSKVSEWGQTVELAESRKVTKSGYPFSWMIWQSWSRDYVSVSTT